MLHNKVAQHARFTSKIPSHTEEALQNRFSIINIVKNIGRANNIDT